MLGTRRLFGLDMPIVPNFEHRIEYRRVSKINTETSRAWGSLGLWQGSGDRVFEVRVVKGEER
jgi:hypothetical protein